ncbi:MAG: hypothetical protein GY807_16705 [Gammaproteobacteria bacterium]|nr:hypothetical protein [Gammaproteobacteria bacterium]
MWYRVVFAVICFCFAANNAIAEEICDEIVFPEMEKEKVDWKDLQTSAFQELDVTLSFECFVKGEIPKREDVQIHALRFDANLFEIKIGLMKELARSHRFRSALEQRYFADEDDNLFRVGPNLVSVSQFHADAEKYYLISSASWWLESNFLEASGLLKIDGKQLNDSINQDLTTVLCLDDDYAGGTKDEVDRRAPVFFSIYRDGKYSPFDKNSYLFKKRVNGLSSWDRIEKCADFFQAGPRVIEYNNSNIVNGYKHKAAIRCLSKERSKKAGICSPKSRGVIPSHYSRKQRLVFAYDLIDPGKGSRYIYFVFSKTPISSYGIQQLLINRWFYNSHGAGNSDREPQVAVILAGADRSGMVTHKASGKSLNGVVDADLPTYLYVVRASDNSD